MPIIHYARCDTRPPDFLKAEIVKIPQAGNRVADPAQAGNLLTLER